MAEDLPIPGYDHLTVETLRHTIRSLDEDGLARLLEYERGHADRPLVKQILVARMEELAAGATPSPGGSTPGPPPPGRSESDLSVRPDTAAHPINPPPHGVPTNAPSRRHDQP